MYPRPGRSIPPVVITSRAQKPNQYPRTELLPLRMSGCRKEEGGEGGNKAGYERAINARLFIFLREAADWKQGRISGGWLGVWGVEVAVLRAFDELLQGIQKIYRNHMKN